VKHLRFWFDPISPYAYLAFEQLPQALEGLSYSVEYRPVLFAGLLRQWGQKGPAEIEPKRAWTFRQIAWAAHQLGIPIDTPAQHPFNPLALLRLLHACAPEGGGAPNRWQCEQVFHHVWRGGADANDAQRLAELRARLAPAPQVPGAQGQAHQLRLVADAGDDGRVLRLHPAGGLQQALPGAEARHGVMTMGMPIGLGVIVFTIVITGSTCKRANSEFDDLTEPSQGVLK
jgi:2-hydroxychromene-2-carboxylate isomerase